MPPRTASLIALLAASASSLVLSPRAFCATNCVPGAQVQCACAGGAPGFQLCQDDGSRFLPCECAVPAARPTLGGLHVSGSPPGKVFLDGVAQPEMPFEVGELKPGRYHLRIEYPEGESATSYVKVRAGETARVYLQPSASERAYAARRGLRYGVGLGGGAVFRVPNGGGGGMVAPTAFANFGLHQALDLRLGIQGAGGYSTKLQSFGMIGIPLSLRLNVGSVYTFALGANVGLRISNPTLSREAENELGVYAGPEGSLATIRFGDQRQYEIGLVTGFAFALSNGANLANEQLNILYSSLTFSMLWL